MELLIAAALGPLLIRTGYAVHAAAMVRSKNSAGAVTRHLMDLCVSALAFWAVGWAIVSAAGFPYLRWSALFGLSDTAAMPIAAVAPVLIATGILPGVLAERARFWPALIASAVLAAIAIPIALQWHGGWLGTIRFRDGAGAGTFHLTGAVAAAVAAYFVGPRTGKFNRDGSSTAIPGHSVPLAGLGVFLQLIGFVVFIGLSSIWSAAAANALLAAAAAGLAAALYTQSRHYKPDCHLIAAAVLGALVAISAGAGSLLGIWAVAIGAAAGVLIPVAILAFDLRLRLDDPTGGVAIHGVGALLGLLATPILASGTTIGERFKGLGAAVLGIIALAALAGAIAFGTWTLLKRTTKLRASEADEFDGLDLAEHDIGAYPDFQQTMIKSYHLREV